MAESGESGVSAKIDARKSQQPRITQVIDKSSNPFLNFTMPKLKLGVPLKLGITAATVSFLSGFVCGYIAAVKQQDLLQNVIRKAVEDGKVIKDEVHKVLEESKKELIKSVVEKILQENKVKDEEKKIEKKRK